MLFALFREISGHYRIAGIAVLCYASNSLFESFDSMFVYQTLALPFFGLTCWRVARLAAARPARPRGPWLTLAAVAIATTVVTHHVTSYVLVPVLVLLAVAGLVTRERPLAAWAAVAGRGRGGGRGRLAAAGRPADLGLPGAVRPGGAAGPAGAADRRPGQRPAAVAGRWPTGPWPPWPC